MTMTNTRFHTYGATAIDMDGDGDGRLDVVWLNMDGPLRAFLNTSPGNHVTIVVPDTVAAGDPVRLALADFKHAILIRQQSRGANSIIR